MTNTIITVIMVSLALLLGTNAGASDLQKGILQYKWSDSASRYNGLSKLGDKGEVGYYSKPGEIIRSARYRLTRLYTGSTGTNFLEYTSTSIPLKCMTNYSFT